ncbi:hypothetical protein RJ640_019520 [Escallonia rubra]|uniref:Transmembrane protein n=1 Tax=Escallonia rubra TaxID=112253 RepID=A0AA88UIU7_9ASTE|nr:hypothetical protein RJ640_019520 [Escallonia rubra]
MFPLIVLLKDIEKFEMHYSTRKGRTSERTTGLVRGNCRNSCDLFAASLVVQTSMARKVLRSFPLREWCKSTKSFSRNANAHKWQIKLGASDFDYLFLEKFVHGCYTRAIVIGLLIVLGSELGAPCKSKTLRLFGIPLWKDLGSDYLSKGGQLRSHISLRDFTFSFSSEACFKLLVNGRSRFMKRKHLIDVTEVFRSLNAEKKNRIAKLGFYVILFALVIIRLVLSVMNHIIDEDDAVHESAMF